MSLLSTHNLQLHFGLAPILDDVSFGIEEGERVCLLGRNGEGKSTLMKVLAGLQTPDSGDIVMQRGASIAYLPQDVPQMQGRVLDVVQSDSDAPDYEIDSLLSRLNLDGDVDFSTLSGGTKRRALLGRALATQPDILLLDEPTNHLDVESILWLEENLPRLVKTVLFVTHDRAFLQKVATRILELDRGNLQSWNCNYTEYLERKAQAIDTEEKQTALFDKRLAEEETWVRKGLKARTTRNEGRVRELEKMREERQARRVVAPTANLQVQTGDKSGALVFEAKDISFAFSNTQKNDDSSGDIEYSNDGLQPNETPIVRNFSTTVMRGDKIGFIGANGSGKTTLLKLLLGQIAPQSGSVKQGTRIQLAWFEQMRGALDDKKTVWQNVAEQNDTVLVNGVHRHVLSYLQDFGFRPERARSKVSVLSGGERNRLLLAKLWTQPANVLVMDEPTNDLDLETLDLLEDLLIEFKGTLLLVSHDRAFLNNVVTSTIAPTQNGQWREYVGGYNDWLRQSKTEQNASNSSSNGATSNGATSSTRSGEKSNQKMGSNAPQSPRARKMSFKESRELEELPAKIEALEARQSELLAMMSQPVLSGEEARQIKADYEAAQQGWATAFARWEELALANG